MLEWEVGGAANNVSKDTFDVGVMGPTGQPPPLYGMFRRWAIGGEPLWLNFSEPTILNLHTKHWADNLVVVPEDFDENSWVYLLIIGKETSKKDSARQFLSAAHPVSQARTHIPATDSMTEAKKPLDPPPRP